VANAYPSVQAGMAERATTCFAEERSVSQKAVNNGRIRFLKRSAFFIGEDVQSAN